MVPYDYLLLCPGDTYAINDPIEGGVPVYGVFTLMGNQQVFKSIMAAMGSDGKNKELKFKKYLICYVRPFIGLWSIAHSSGKSPLLTTGNGCVWG